MTRVVGWVRSPLVRLALAAVLAQLLDLASASPFHEINGLVLWLGPAAPAAKLGLIPFVLVVAYILSRTRYRVVGGVVLGFAVVVGGMGAVSNVVAR